MVSGILFPPNIPEENVDGVMMEISTRRGAVTWRHIKGVPFYEAAFNSGYESFIDGARMCDNVYNKPYYIDQYPGLVRSWYCGWARAYRDAIKKAI